MDLFLKYKSSDTSRTLSSHFTDTLPMSVFVSIRQPSNFLIPLHVQSVEK